MGHDAKVGARAVLAGALALGAVLSASHFARADMVDEPPKDAAPPHAANTDDGDPAGKLDAVAWNSEALTPLDTPFLQYGVAFTAETIASAGPICSNTTQPCILGSGGGLAVRVGRRSAGPWYFGGAYELSKQDPNQLYRLGILQQVRAEVRHYFFVRHDLQPLVSVGLGAVGYGNEWSVQTFGPMGFVSVGVEFQLSRRTVVGAALAYRLLDFSPFVDSSNAQRNAGITQVVGLELSLEGRDPL